MNPATESQKLFTDVVTRVDGYPEVGVTWVADHLGEFRFIDVREPHELQGPLGQAEGVENIPMKEFLERLDQLDREQPIVLICRSGRRSALAAEAAEEAGFTNVVTAEGGMLAWNQYVLEKPDIRATEKHANADNLRDAIFDYNGVPEVSVHWAAQNLGRFRLVDVREDHELVGELGRVLQSEHVPLGGVVETMKAWDKDAPYVIMCRSGGRSARATLALMNQGFTNVASLEGGMTAWNGAELPVARPN